MTRTNVSTLIFQGLMQLDRFFAEHDIEARVSEITVTHDERVNILQEATPQRSYVNVDTTENKIRVKIGGVKIEGVDKL